LIGRLRRKIEYAKAQVRAKVEHFCPVGPVDDAKAAAGCGRGAPVMREKRLEKALFKGETMS
jgi:hypothetical protein